MTCALLLDLLPGSFPIRQQVIENFLSLTLSLAYFKPLRDFGSAWIVHTRLFSQGGYTFCTSHEHFGQPDIRYLLLYAGLEIRLLYPFFTGSHRPFLLTGLKWMFEYHAGFFPPIIPRCAFDFGFVCVFTILIHL